VAKYVDKAAAKERGISLKPSKEITDSMKPARNKRTSVVRTLVTSCPTHQCCQYFLSVSS
jgi:hypothetical protein